MAGPVLARPAGGQRLPRNDAQPGVAAGQRGSGQVAGAVVRVVVQHDQARSCGSSAREDGDGAVDDRRLVARRDEHGNQGRLTEPAPRARPGRCSFGKKSRLLSRIPIMPRSAAEANNARTSSIALSPHGCRRRGAPGRRSRGGWARSERCFDARIMDVPSHATSNGGVASPRTTRSASSTSRAAITAQPATVKSRLSSEQAKRHDERPKRDGQRSPYPESHCNGLSAFEPEER